MRKRREEWRGAAWLYLIASRIVGSWGVQSTDSRAEEDLGVLLFDEENAGKPSRLLLLFPPAASPANWRNFPARKEPARVRSHSFPSRNRGGQPGPRGWS